MQRLFSCTWGVIFLVCPVMLEATHTSGSGFATQVVDITTKEVEFSVMACQFAAVQFHTNHANEMFTLVLDVPQPGGFTTYLRNYNQRSMHISGKVLNCKEYIQFKVKITSVEFEITRIDNYFRNSSLIGINTNMHTDITITRLMMKTIWNEGQWIVLDLDITTASIDAASSSATWTRFDRETQVILPFYHKTGLSIDIKACTHAQIGFISQGKFYDIIIGGLNNTLSHLYIDGFLAVGDGTSSYGSYLKCNEFTQFHLKLDVSSGILDLKKNDRSIIKYEFNDEEYHQNTTTVVKSFQYRTVGVRGEWKFGFPSVYENTTEGNLGWDDLPSFTYLYFDKSVTHFSFSVTSCQHALMDICIRNHTQHDEYWTLTIDKPFFDGNGVAYTSWLCSDDYSGNCSDYNSDNRLLGCTKSLNFEVKLTNNSLKILTQDKELLTQTINLRGEVLFKTVEVSTVWSIGQWLIADKYVQTENIAKLEYDLENNTLSKPCENRCVFGVKGYQHAYIDINTCSLRNHYSVVIGGITNRAVQIYKDNVLEVVNNTNTVVLSSSEYLNFTLKIEDKEISLFSGNGLGIHLILRYEIHDSFSYCDRVRFHNYWVKWKFYEKETSTTTETHQTQHSQSGDGFLKTTLWGIKETPSPLKTTILPEQKEQSVEELAEEIKATKEKLTVKKKKTSTYIRTKTCAEDNRVSSVTIGSGGIVFLVLTFVFILAIDLPNLKKMFMTLYENISNSELAHVYRTYRAKRESRRR